MQSTTPFGNWLLAFMLCVFALVKDVNANEPLISCSQSGETCAVRLQVSPGEWQEFDLIREARSIFSNYARVLSVDGTEYSVHSRQRKGIRYHSRKGDKHLATALIAEDKSKIVEGVFGAPEHGFFEFNHGLENEPTVKRRKLETIQDIMLPLPDEWKRVPIPSAGDEDQKRLATSTEDPWDSSAATAASGTTIPFFPGCYPEDLATHVVKINIVLDAGVVSSLSANIEGDPTNAILENLEGVLSMGKLIFYSQLNIRLEVDRVILGTASMSIPLSRSSNTLTCTTATQTMEDFTFWISKLSPNEQTGYWALASNCFNGAGVNGVSHIGSVCASAGNGGVSAYTWPVIFHEMGHAFGMSHSFENGVGTTGGLMDYGNTLYNGVSQFHPNKRTEACNFLTILKRSDCPYFRVAPASSQCGDGILTESEQCECLDKSKSCGNCVNCLLTDPSIECSESVFVIRTKDSPSILIAEQSGLSSSECCLRNRLAPPKTLCGNGKLDACGYAGKCSKICTALLYPDNQNCGFDDTGCKLGCVWNNKCRFDMLYGEGQLISGMPDGTSCSFQGIKGKCKNAVCVTSMGTPPPTRGSYSPTVSPFYNEQEITLEPTLRPTKRTKNPTNRPTRRPTRVPTTRAPTTKTPTILDSKTLAPGGQTDSGAKVDQKQARCRRFKKKKNCMRKGCNWCGRQQNCNHVACAELAKKQG